MSVEFVSREGKPLTTIDDLVLFFTLQTTPGAKPGASGSSHKCTTAAPAAPAPAPAAASPSPPPAPAETAKPAPINAVSHGSRLGLARAYAKSPDTIEEAKKYYNQVIDMAPQVSGLVQSLVELCSK